MARSAPPPTLARWQRTIGFWRARRAPACALYTLGMRNIYVLPSAAGWMLALTLLVLLVASINFQLNLGYALTFLIAGSALASVWMGHRNLRGVQLRLGAIAPVFQGERASVPVILRHTQPSRDCHGLSIALSRSQSPLAWVHTDVTPGPSIFIELSSTAHQRGWHRVPRIVIESRFPLGVFRLWSYWQPDAQALIYPAPETPMPPICYAGSDGDPSQPASAATAGMAEPDGVRLYQRGDALRSVVWKKAATALATGTGDLVVRHGSKAPTHSLWLDARATALADPEAQISRLTAWVLHAHAQQWQWGLKLPSGRQLPPNCGELHLQDCLAALAVDGKPAGNSEK